MWVRVIFLVFLLFQYFEYSFGVPNFIRSKRQISTAEANSLIEMLNSCSCVLYYQCDTDGFIITSGEGLFDIRLGSEKENDEQNRTMCKGGKFEGEMICCKHRPGEENKPPATTPPTTGSTAASTFKQRKTLQCGKQRPSINVRIWGDEMAPLEGEFPWLAALYKKDPSSNQWKHHKSGSLIHPKVILTGAHVVKRTQANELKVIVNGQIELSQIGDNPTQERNIIEIINHPEFSSGTLYNDVALLILDEPYNSSTTRAINTICLRPNIPFENKRCFVAGWGKTAEGSVAKVLKKVEVPAHPHSNCEEMLRKTRLGPNFRLDESLTCAGGEEGKDACSGDGGSPLVCPTGSNDAMYQVGLVAYGIGCGMKDVPGVYANVVHLHNWIVDALKQYDIKI